MVRNFSSYDEWKKAQEEKEKSITDSVKNSGMGTDQSSGQQRTFKSYDEWKEVNRPEEYRKEQAELLKQELERPRKEYEAKVQEFDTKIQEEKENKWQSKLSIFGWKPLGNIPSKKEKELATQKAEFTAQTYNRKYSQEYRDKILAEKPKEVKLSDEQYISLREDVDVRLKYLNSVKANLTEQDNNLNKFTQWGVTQKNAADGTESVRKVPFLPTKELVAQSNTYNLQTDWSEGYEYLKKAAKESGMSEEEYAKSYNAQISGQMLDIYQKVVGDVSLTKEDIINTTRRTGIPAVDDNQIRIEIENINQYLDTAKKIYDEYTGVREVEKVDGIKGYFSKEGGKVIGEKILSGTAPFVNMFFNSKQEGFLDIGQIEQLKNKLESGGKLTTAETSRLLLTEALETNDQIDRGLWTRVAEGTPEALAMVGEMAATYGIFAGTGTAVRTAGTAATQKISYQAAKEIVETAAQEGGKNWVRTLFAKGGFKEGSKMIAKNVAVALIAEVPETIVKDSFKIAAEVMKTDSRISFSDPETEQQFMKIVRDDEEYNSDWANDLTKAFARQYFNNVLERGGGEIIEAPIDIAADKLKMLIIGKYMSQKGIQTLDEFSKVYDTVGFQGMFGEVFEEYAQDYAESIIDNRDFVIDDPDKFWDIVAQVGVLQLGRAGSVATTVTDVTKNLITGQTFQTDQQVPPVEGETPIDTRVGQDVDTLVTNTQTGESVQDDLQTKEIIRQQQVSGETQTILTEPVDDATLLSKAQALSDISKQTDYSLSSLTELKKLEKQATDEKTAQAIATISDSYANVLAKKIADGSANIGQQIDTQLQDNIKEISPDETVQEGIKSTKQQILETPNKQYYVQEKGKFKEIKDAQSIKIINEADTFIYRDLESKLYQVVEAKSGMAIAEASTKGEVVKQATAKLNKMGVETFQSKIQEAISKKGVSPRYIKKEVKKVAKKEILKKEVTGAAKESMQVESKQLEEDAKKLSKADFVKEFGYLFDYEDSPYKVSAEEFYDNALREEISPAEKTGLKVGSKIKVQGKLREVSDFGKSARDSQGVMVRFTDGTYITLDKAQEYAAQKQTKDAVKKESTQKTKEAIKEAEETVKKIEKEKKVDQNQLAKRRMDIGKTNPEVKKITKDLKDFEESEDYVALKDEYKILLKEAGVTHSSLESYIDNMIDMYGEEAATYLEDFMQRWTAAQTAIETLTERKTELINNQLREEGYSLPKYRQYRKPEDRDLLVIRNMSREGVEKVLESGGMPVPSVAITKFDIPFTDFGEISFIGTSDMVDPSDEDVRVLTNDAWTPTIPTPEFEMKNPNYVLTEQEKAYLEKNNIYNYLTSESDARTAIRMAEDIGEKAIKLVNKVTGDPILRLKNPNPKGLLGRAIKEHPAIRKIWKESRSFYDFNLMYENEAETIDIMEAYAKELYPEDGDDAFYNPEFEKQLSVEYEIIEPYNNAEAMTKKILQDIETYNAGDVRADKGFSPLRAKVAQQFNSIEEIIGQSERLKPKGENEKEGKEGEFELENALSKLSDKKKELFTKPFQDFSEFESMTNYFAYQPKLTKKLLTDYFLKNASNGKWAMYKDSKTGEMKSMRETPTLKDIQELLSHVDVEKLNKYFDDEYRKPVTDMFEAKILRNVQVEEWRGAVVPNDIDPKLKEAIKKAGGQMFKLFEYDPKKPETRQEAIDNFKDYRFRFETEYEKITGEKASKETINKIKQLNKKFFGDENVRVVDRLLSEDGQKVYGRYLAGWIDILNNGKELEPTYYHETVHKALEIISSINPKVAEKILDEVIETKGLDYLQNKWGSYAPDTIAKYLYETARRRDVRGYDEITSMADIRRNLAILRADQRREVKEKYMEIENKGITYDADYLSDYAINSMAKSGEQKMKPDRLQGEGISYEEARTGKARNGKDLVDRIVFGKNDAGDIIIKDGRHLLEAYRELELPVPVRKVKFEDGVQALELSTDPEIVGDLIARYRGATNQDNAYIWAEEELAENFIDYVQGRETFTGEIKQFFDDLLEFIKSLVGAESEIKKLYRELYSGHLSEKQINNIQKQYIPKYRADLLFDEEVETEPTKLEDERLFEENNRLVLKEYPRALEDFDEKLKELGSGKAMVEYIQSITREDAFIGEDKDDRSEKVKSIEAGYQVYFGNPSIQKKYDEGLEDAQILEERIAEIKGQPLEITKTPEKGVIYETKGTSILPSRKLQQQIEETLMSGQSTPATRSVTAFMPVIETAGKIKDSTAFNKIRDRYEEIQELDPSMNELKYKSMSIADITAKAMAFVDEYPAEARRVALGMELAPEGTTNVAVSLAYTEKMFEEGKWKQAREADRALSLRGTRLGQEIVSFKGRLNANSPMFFMEQVLNARRMVVSSRMFKSGSLENFAKMKQERMAEVAKSLKQIKLEKAEDFINKLIC